MARFSDALSGNQGAGLGRHSHGCVGDRTAKPSFRGVVVSLPLVSLLGIIWLWRDTGDTSRIAAHAEATFWYVLPSLPMFLAFPYMLRHGVDFWPALLAGCLLTVVLYGLTVLVAARLGTTLSGIIKRDAKIPGGPERMAANYFSGPLDGFNGDTSVSFPAFSWPGQLDFINSNA